MLGTVKKLNELFPNLWKYLLVSIISIILATVIILIVLTYFYSPNTVIVNNNDVADSEERQGVYKAFLENEENIRLEFKEQMEEIEERFHEVPTREEFNDRLDRMLDIDRSSRPSPTH